MNCYYMQLLQLIDSPISMDRNPLTSYTLDVTHTYLTLQPFYSQNLGISAQMKALLF